MTDWCNWFIDLDKESKEFDDWYNSVENIMYLANQIQPVKSRDEAWKLWGSYTINKRDPIENHKYRLESAYMLPFELLLLISKKFPEITFSISYGFEVDPTRDYFEFIIKNGNILKDNYENVYV
jgi:hypothetical protein